MNGGIAPLLLLGAAFGLALSFTQWRAAWIALVTFGGAMLIASVVPVPNALQDALIFGLLASTLASAALVYLPGGLPALIAFVAAVNDGAWLGLVGSVTNHRPAIAFGLALALLFVPGQWIVKRGYSIAIKVVCSWLIAIASLAIFVSLVPTPGYKPDHMQ